MIVKCKKARCNDGLRLHGLLLVYLNACFRYVWPLKEILMLSLLRNVHLEVEAPGPAEGVVVVKGDYEYWHYCCDGCDDRVCNLSSIVQNMCAQIHVHCMYRHTHELINKQTYHRPTL
jgi:hypothetical protein